MPYLPIAVVVLVGVTALTAVSLRVIGALRRFRAATTLVGDQVGDGVGLLKARSAALGVAFAERRPQPARQGKPRVPSTDRGRQEDHRG
ncbi:bacteriophage holin [Actinosynnema sp. NPDC020468]|uniref:bacteriophage holin n=1 Tax=Actinosynnema sp. NPDC020468 TaxID=3154488 RepID=UPI00340AC160